MDVMIAAAILVAVLALSDLGPIRAAFDALALGLAVVAAPLLDTIGLPVSRTGAELRGVVGNWAVAVTEVCDGHGLVAAWLALVTTIRRTRLGPLVFGLLGVAAIQAFNLFRVVVLAAVLSIWPSSFEIVHLYVFPLLTIAFFAVLLWLGAQINGRMLLVVLAVGTIAALLWALVGVAISGMILVAPANVLLGFVQPTGIASIVGSGDGWAVATVRLASLEPPSFLQAPIHPEDFSVALSALVAAAIAARGGAVALFMALGLMIVALAFGATTAVWSLSGEGTPDLVVQTLPTGELEVTPYVPAGETTQSLVRLAQNGIVHFNLLVLPLMILMGRATAQPGTPE